jgi:Domain of unknown function (DUF5655)
VTKNLWHSCGQHSIDGHFEGKAPVVRRIFDAFAERVRGCGAVTIYAQKSRIVCMVTVRFAAVSARKNALIGHLWMERGAEHPCITKVETFGARSILNHFRFTDPAQIDDAFAALVAEAYSSHHNV